MKKARKLISSTADGKAQSGPTPITRGSSPRKGWSATRSPSSVSAAGSGPHLGDLVLEERFLEALYDCLDKARIELDEAWQGSVA